MTLTHRHEDKTPGMLLGLIAIFGIAVSAIVYSFGEGISGNDFWWHIKIGEWIMEHGAVPTEDIFSWYGVANGFSWTAHEWLADVVLYLVYAWTGEWGMFALSVTSAVLMLVLLWTEARRYVEKNILIGGIFFALLGVTASVFFYGRPHLFSFFLLYWELKVLFAFVENPKSKGIYTVPLLACLWSNLHGGSASLCYVLCAVFLAVGLLDLRIGKIEPVKLDRQATVKLLAVTVCAVAAILLNPVGLEVLVYPYKNLSDQLQMTLISEWRSPDAKQMGDLILFICPVALVLLGMFAEEKRIRLIDLAVMGMFVLLFLRSVRFIMLWYIAAVFCGLPYVPQCKIKPIRKQEERALIAACLLVFAAVIGVSGARVYKTAESGSLIWQTMSREAIEAVKEDAPQRLFNDYNLGEALIYHEIPVFFDARADLYAQDHIMADGVSLMLLEQANADRGTPYVDVMEVIGQYEFDAILILKSRPLYAFLRSHPDQFVCIFEDDNLGYFRVVR